MGLQVFLTTYETDVCYSYLVRQNEDTLLGTLGADKKDEYSKIELGKVKSDLEKFFRNAGTVELGSLKSSQASGSYKTMNYIREIIEEEFPLCHDQVPKGQELVYMGEVERNKGMYAPGDWVGKTLIYVQFLFFFLEYMTMYNSDFFLLK